MKKTLSCFIIASFLAVTTPVTLQAREQVTIKYGMKSYTITQQQLNKIKVQEGIHFFKELPKIVPSPLIAVAIPEELGGGYLIGNRENMAKAFNAAGITVGLTGTAISGKTMMAGGVVLITLAVRENPQPPEVEVVERLGNRRCCIRPGHVVHLNVPAETNIPSLFLLGAIPLFRWRLARQQFLVEPLFQRRETVLQLLNL